MPRLVLKYTGFEYFILTGRLVRYAGVDFDLLRFLIYKLVGVSGLIHFQKGLVDLFHA